MVVTITEVHEILRSAGRMNSLSRFGRYVVVTFLKNSPVEILVEVPVLLTTLLELPAMSSAARLKSDPGTKGEKTTIWDVSLE